MTELISKLANHEAWITATIGSLINCLWFCSITLPLSIALLALSNFVRVKK